MSETTELEVDAIIDSISVARTVVRKAAAVEKPTTKVEANAMRALVAESTKERATTEMDSASLQALGVISMGEMKRPPPAPQPVTVKPSTWKREQAPVESVQVDRGYKKAVTQARLAIEEIVHDESVTIPISVVRSLATVAPLAPSDAPRGTQKTVPLAKPGTSARRQDLYGFAVGIFIGVVAAITTLVMV